MQRSNDKIRPVINRILELGLQEFEIESFIGNTAENLIQSGYALYRLHITARIIHPIYSGVSFTWTRDKPIETDNYRRDDIDNDNFLKSPVRYALENSMDEFRIRINQGEGLDRFPIIKDLSKEGATDYFLVLSRFGEQETAIERRDGLIMTWTCDHPDGWSEQDQDDIRRLQSRMAVVVRLSLSQSLAQNISTAYLGDDAGMRVLSGQIQRGDGDEIDAVIWFSDLRSSTRLAASMDPTDYIKLLNQFFECTAGAALETGGEILSYIGDSVLSIFPCAKAGGPTQASQTALQAAQLASSRINGLNKQRIESNQEPIGFGIGLHYGSVVFGNIGIPERLGFSVIGRVANEAARITDRCRELEEEVLVSEIFKELAGGDWRKLGEFHLRNVESPMNLFAPEI